MTRSHWRKISLFAASALITGLGKNVLAHAPEAQTGGASAHELFVVFDKEPKAQGLQFERRAFKPATVTVGDKTNDAWVAQQGSARDVPYARSVLLTVTDPRFKEGKQPAVDIEVEYRLEADAGVYLLADTQDGSKEVGRGWGRSKQWKTLRARVDNAHFGARQFGSAPKNLQTDGYDLRINATTSDLFIRRIKVTGYDLDHNVDYQRLLKLERIESPNDILLFSPNQKQTLTYQFWNIARRPTDLSYTFTLTDWDGKTKARHDGTLRVEGGGRAPLLFPLDTRGFRHGVYLLNLILNQQAPATKPILERTSYVGVASAAKLPKAKNGEFLYGLDVLLGHAYDKPRLLQWINAMGVDILRGGHGSGKIEDLEKNLAVYERRGLRTLFIDGPRHHPDPDKRRAQTAQQAQRFEALARRFPQIRYWELGNEPDLPFFYAGPIEAYAEDYATLYQAIKRGNPETVVMNGGLCFAGDEAKRRARRFVEVIDPKHIDAWAYHGHGPGARAERNALETMRRTAREWAKHEKPFIETESGVAARTQAQEETQARTAIQKMVFAQSEKLPLFMWFRLLMFEESYGNLRTDQEPRPAVLSYRAMVEALRGHAFRRLINVGNDQVEAYLFAQNGGPGRACVLWTGSPATRNVYLDIASRPDRARNLRIVDLYGNPGPAVLVPGGAVQVAVTESPVFLLWDTSEPSYAVQRATPVLQTTPVAQLVRGANNTLSIAARNPLARPLKATLTVATNGDVPATIAPAQRTLLLKPGASQTIDFTVRLGETRSGLDWPRTWTAFTNVDEKQIDLATIAQIPASLPGAGGAVQGKSLTPSDHVLDFEKAGGKRSERALALVFAEVISDADRTITMGASADWWMAWYVNGRPVYDTLQHGNGGGHAISDHTFTVRLKKGVNLLAAKVLSGSQGWKLLIGDPAALAKTEKGGADQLTLTLRENGKVFAKELVEMQYTSPIATLPADLSWEDDMGKWEQQAPVAQLEGPSVHNFFEKEPDASRWWRGADDLSATAWLRHDRDRVYLVVKVKDDAHSASKQPDALWQADSLQVGIAQAGRDDRSEYAIAASNGTPMIFKHARRDGAPAGIVDAQSDEIQAKVERIEPGTTVYRVSLDRRAIGPGDFFINFIVNDRDTDAARKQFIAWKPGLGESKEPGRWHRAAIVE